MPGSRIPGLPRNAGGVVQVGSPAELAQVLAFEGADLSSEWVDFASALWRPVQDVRERAEIYRFLTLAAERVCAAGLLPRAREKLAPFGGSAPGRWITRFAPVMIRRRCRDLRAALIK